MARTVIRFGVAGVAVPQGSFIARVIGGKSFAVPSNDNELRKWRKRVAGAALATLGRTERDPAIYQYEAVVVRIVIRLPRPASVNRKNREFPNKRPDIDKLARGVLDALTGIAYFDDGQVCRLVVDKDYDDDAEAGVEVMVYQRFTPPTEGNPTDGKEGVRAQA